MNRTFSSACWTKLELRILNFVNGLNHTKVDPLEMPPPPSWWLHAAKEKFFMARTH